MTPPLELPRSLAVLAVAVLMVLTAPGAASAEPGETALTWTVQPANQSGPDGRRWVERTLDPGQVITEYLAVRNFSDTAGVFALKAADGYLTDRGRFNMLPSDRRSVDGGTWIRVQETVTVGPKETRVVPFTITVPRDAAPGDHPAGIAATITSTGGTVNVESRVGFRVMLRASGAAEPSLAISGLTARYERSWNPFRSGTIRVTYTVTNDGNVWVAGKSRIEVSELFGAAGHDSTADVDELLPGGTRTVETGVGGVWALGRLRTTVTLTPTALGDAKAGTASTGTDSTDTAERASATVTVWTVPWPQLAVAVLLAALALTLWTLMRHRRRRLARMLAAARDEGRAAALAGSR